MNTIPAATAAFDPLHFGLLAALILALLLIAWLWQGQARLARTLASLREAHAALTARAEALAPLAAELPALREEANRLGVLLAGARATADERATALAAVQDETVVLKRDLDLARADVAALRADLAAEKAQTEERTRAVVEREAALIEMKKQVEETFHSLASKALAANQQSFLEVANETLSKQQQASALNLETVLSPVKEALGQFREKIEAVQKERAEDRASLVEQVRNIGEALQQTRAETGRLVTALRASPKTRGRWGEEQLRNILELSGLSSVADFTEQMTVDKDGSQQRPDVVIRLPGDRSIVVDSKVALDAYLEAIDAPDEAAREVLLKRHAQAVRNHAKQLGGKAYWATVPNSADFVALFIPGENFFAAAAERDPDLIQDALAMKVVIVTPATLFALAKAVSYGWRQAEAETNAREIAALGKELYTRLSVMGDGLTKLGKTIDGTVRTYNDLIGTVEARVLPSARRFRKFEAADPSLTLDELQPLERSTRTLKPGSELLLPAPADGE